MSFVVLAVLLIVVVAAVIFGIRFLSRRRTAEESGGLDLIAYGLLAIAVVVAAFAVAGLARTAFPGETIVGDQGQQVATSLAALVVSAPIAVLLWRRQAIRRQQLPDTAGWPVYLAVMEAVFMTALVISAFGILNWLIGDGNEPPWTDLVVFAAVVALHEVAAARTPPGSDAADLPRVVGSAIGLIPTAIGVAGILYWIFDQIYGSFAATAGEFELGTAFSFLLVGAPVWYFRWWRPWPTEPSTPRKAWLVVTSVAGIFTTLGALVAIAILVVVYLFGDPEPAAEHFEFLSLEVATLLVALGVWIHHRRRLGAERDNTLRSYEYLMTAIALGFAVGGLTSLAAVAFGNFDIVTPGDPSVPLSLVVVVVVSLVAWWWFWSNVQSAPRETEAPATPRRFYLLGMAVVSGLTAAQALISSLVVVFQQLMEVDGNTDVLAVEAPLFVFAGIAAWHLMHQNAQDRKLFEAEEVITPFSVTIICSHPGNLAAMFPKQAKVRVVYRADEAGVIDPEMADRIAEAVGHRSSLVWVGEHGFEVAPARFD